MNQPLIVGIDGSDHGLRALDWAVTAASRHELPIRIVYGILWERYEEVPPPYGSVPSPRHVVAERIVSSAAERVQRMAPTLKVSTSLVPSDPVTALLGEAETAFAIVVGNRGHGPITGTLFLGSTSLEVSALARCPVVVVRGASPNIRGDNGRVTLGVGCDGESSAAVGFALREAQARDAELRAIRVWHRPAGDLLETPDPSGDDAGREGHEAELTVVDALHTAVQEFPKVSVHRETPEGRAHHVLLNASASSDLLVVGAHRRPEHVGVRLSLVTHMLLHHADCPVAVVPQAG